MSGGAPSARVVVLASGRGSNFAALAEAVKTGRLKLELAALVSDREDAPCLNRARDMGVTALAFPRNGRPRAEYDHRLAELVGEYHPDWIFLLGWMRILTNSFLSKFPGRVVNLHPALPGSFPGVDAIRRAWEAARQGATNRTGVMLHLVPDEGVDSGPVLMVREIEIGRDESLESLEARTHELEHELVVELAGRLRKAGIEGLGIEPGHRDDERSRT